MLPLPPSSTLFPYTTLFRSLPRPVLLISEFAQTTRINVVDECTSGHPAILKSRAAELDGCGGCGSRVVLRRRARSALHCMWKRPWSVQYECTHRTVAQSLHEPADRLISSS